MKLLDAYRIRATWTAASLALERAPQIAEAIVARGDEPCCHGYRWAHQFWMNEDKERDFIRKGWQSIEKTCGRRPAGWLSRYMHTEETRRLLAEEGFFYHMDDYSDDFPFWDRVETGDGAKSMVIMKARETGMGCDVDVSLFDVALHQLSYPGVWAMNGGHIVGRLPRGAHPAIAPSQTVKTMPGRIRFLSDAFRAPGERRFISAYGERRELNPVTFNPSKICRACLYSTNRIS